MEQTTVYEELKLPTANPKIFRAIFVLLTALGFLLSAYLLYHHYVLATEGSENIDICSAVFGKGCDNALNSPVASQLGLSLAGWGIIYYLTLTSIFFLPNIFGNVFTTAVKPALFALSLFSCLVAICLLTLMLLQPALFCPLCTTLHVLNILNFFVVMKITGYSFSPVLHRWKTGVGHGLSKAVGDNHFKLKLFGFLTILLVAIALYVGLQMVEEVSPDAKKNFNEKENLKAFKAEPKLSIPVDADDPVYGAKTASAEIIVFSDFECPSCRYFYLVLNELKKTHAGKFRVVYKHFPLGKACNAFVDKDVHPHACEAAMASEAARQQGKFWEYHDSLFMTNLALPDKTICSIADSIGLDHASFEKYRTSADAIAKIKRTTELANRLGVSGTPAVFLNGRLVKNFSLPSMISLLNNALASNGN